MTSCSGMQLTKLICPAATPAGQSLRHAARLQTVGEAARPGTLAMPLADDWVYVRFLILSVFKSSARIRSF